MFSSSVAMVWYWLVIVKVVSFFCWESRMDVHYHEVGSFFFFFSFFFFPNLFFCFLLGALPLFWGLWNFSLQCNSSMVLFFFLPPLFVVWYLSLSLGVCKELQRRAAVHLQMAAFVFSESSAFPLPWSLSISLSLYSVYIFLCVCLTCLV